jgi:hypothetical protein
MEPFKFLGRVKDRLSHVDADALHYQLTEWIWKSKAQNSKACSYYWLKLPSSLLIGGCIAIGGALVLVFMLFLWGAFFFCGFWLSVFNSEKKHPTPAYYNSSRARMDNRATYGYKRLYTNKSVRLAPWEIAALLGVFYGLYYSFALHTNTIGVHYVLPITGVVLACLMALGVAFYFFASGWKLPRVQEARRSIKAAWDRACPPLVVEKAQSPEVEA